MARLGATVTDETVERLRALAAQYGLIARAGRHIGQPSVSELLDAIGDGRLEVVPGEAYMAYFAKSARLAMEGTSRLVNRLILNPKDVTQEAWQARFDEEIALYAETMGEATRLMEMFAERPRQAPLPLGEESDAEAADEEE